LGSRPRRRPRSRTDRKSPRRIRADRGGIRSLGRIVDERWNAVEADFQRFYGLDLRTNIVDAGVRRIWALVEGLPPDAAVWREDSPFVTRDPASLLGLLVEEVGRWSLLNIAALRGGRIDQDNLKLMEIRKRQPVTTDRSRIARFFNG
jgi:hypothetical protein